MLAVRGARHHARSLPDLEQRLVALARVKALYGKLNHAYSAASCEQLRQEATRLTKRLQTQRSKA